MQTPNQFRPFIAPSAAPLEFTLRAVILGSILGIVFAASSVYLGLKVGLTVSASIPVAVLSITLFRWFAHVLKLRPANILENNIVQTTGSAGESIAAGVAFTLPSLLLMGFELELMRILMVALLGGLLGVLMMIPLRYGLIVKEHGTLTYPEGTACADVLIVGEKGGTQAKTVFLGFFTGLGYSTLNLINKLWSDTSHVALNFWGYLKGGMVAFEVSPPMLGVGYIIGPRVSAIMMSGGMLAFVILIPLIRLFGDGLTSPMFPETVKTIAQMSSSQIRNAYVLYIGAGAVATGGFVSLARSLPTIFQAFRSGLSNFRSAGTVSVKPLRTEMDLPMTLVIGGSIALAIAMAVAPVLNVNAFSAVLIVLFGFFFVTVSSRITGEIGSSSNPISGMTVATLLITCGLFVLIGWTGVNFKAMALTTAALVCVAASNGGTISQDLKTGFLVGATPKYQQIAIGIGVITSAIVIGFVLLLLNQSHTTFEPIKMQGDRIPMTAAMKKTRGPLGVEYYTHYIREDNKQLPRGAYLVDDAGQIKFRMDPGVCGTFPYRLEKKSFSTPLAVPSDSPLTEGLDQELYRVVQIDKTQGDITRGRYLTDESGHVQYAQIPVWKFDAPKAQLFRLIIDGTLGGRLPWGLVLVGVFLALMMELVGVSSLPFAVGLYLPISTSAGIFVGGAVRYLVDRKRKDLSAAEAEFSPGVLLASGLIAGGAIAGVLQSIVAFYEKDEVFDFSNFLGALAQNETWWPMAPFMVMAAVLYFVGVKEKK